MNPFADYGKRATSTATPRLVGISKTRAAAKDRYVEIVGELEACEDAGMLDCFLATIAPDIAQFRAEIDLYWDGEDDFLGLRREIERAKARFDDSRQDRRY